MKSKTIILSSQNDQEKGRGILTLFIEDDLLKCKLRLYNIPTLNRFCKLGIYHQNEVFSANLLEKNGSYVSSLVGNFDMEKDFYSAIIDTSKNNNVILSGGTYSGYFSHTDTLFDNVEKENPNTNLYDYTDEDFVESLGDPTCHVEPNETSHKQSDDVLLKMSKHNINEDCDKCANCKYKEFFYSQQTLKNVENIECLQESSTSLRMTAKDACTPLTPLGMTDDAMLNPSKHSTNACHVEQNEVQSKHPTNDENHSIIQSLMSQFEYVFENYTADATLNSLIPNGKFVKINENQESYSIGAIFEENNMRYICYAVPRDYNSSVPKELGEHYQWLPIDKEDPLSDGYYIVFQDAQDLKIVEM